MIEELWNIENYLEAFKKIKKASGWKTNTKNYETELVKNLHSLINSIKDNKYYPSVPTYFKYNERGKIRVIESYCINDRLVMDVLCNKILLPRIRKYLIYDNSASLKGRGTKHFQNRLKLKYKQFLKENNSELENPGYVLVGDYRKYFDNLGHQQFLDSLKRFKIDDQTLDFVKMLLRGHRIELNGLSKQEIEELKTATFDSVDFMLKHPERYKTRQRYLSKEDVSNFRKKIDDLDDSHYLCKSMGIGGQLAQLAGVIGAYRIDNYCKIVKGLKYYGRYMDDFYIFGKTKEELQIVLDGIKRECSNLGLFLNEKKTQIVKLTRGFTILKRQYKLKDNNKIYIIPSKDRFVRERRKIKKFRIKLEQNKMTADDIAMSFASWRGNIISQCGITRSLKSIETLYDKLFVEDWLHERRE